MPLELYFTFIAASATLIAAPGPMNAFIVSTSLSRGLAWGLAATCGAVAGAALHLSVVALGLSVILNAASAAFLWIKWIGVLYMLYLGVRAWRRPPEALDAAPATGSLLKTAVEAFFVNVFNPNAVLFHSAFLPLFIMPEEPVGPQLALLAVTFLIIVATLDAAWAFGAARARPFFSRRKKWTNRLTGTVLILAAIGLAAVQKA